VSALKPEELKQIREEVLQITVTAMAGLLGVPRATYRKYEKGDFPIPDDLAERIDQIVAEEKAGGGLDSPTDSPPRKPAPKRKKAKTPSPPEPQAPEPEKEEEAPAKSAESPRKKPEPAPVSEEPSLLVKESALSIRELIQTTETQTGLAQLVRLLSSGKKVRIEISLVD